MPGIRESAHRFAQGAGLPLRALRLLTSNPSTWPFAWAPILLTAAGLAFGLTIGWRLSGALLGALWTRPGSGWFLPGLWQVIHVVLYALGALIDALTLPEIAGAPLNDLLSAQVERIVRGETESERGLKRLAREVWASMAAAAARLLRFGLIQAALLLINLIPGAQPVYPVVAFLWSALWLAQQYLDLTMARHLHTPSETRAALRSVRPLALGLGLVLGAIFLIPLANLLLVPVGVASGALLYCDLLEEGKVTPPKSTGRS